MTGDQLSIEDALNAIPGARNTDPDTSHDAAAAIKIRAGSQRHLLLDVFVLRGHAGYTDEEAMHAADGVTPTSEYSKRCSELREGGFIEPTGETRPGAAGVERIVSRATAKGRTWWENNQ